MNSVDRAGVNAGAAINAGVWVNNTLVPLLADGVNRARIFTCCAVGAIVCNSVCHGTTS